MLKPNDDRILVLPDALRDDVTASGLIVSARQGLTESQAQLGRTGTVVAVGPGKFNKRGVRVPLDLMEGDRIAFGEFKYAEFVQDGVRYLVMQEADVVGVLEAEAA